MEFLELAKKRYSVRSFTDQQIEEEKLAKILEAGRVAPTAANCQPQRILVVRDKDRLTALQKAANTYGAPLILVVCADKTQAWVRPFDKKNCSDIDASIVTDHMMMEATELGLGSVWICYFKPDIVKELFNIPDSLEPVNILAVGYADCKALSPDRHSQTRKPIGDITFYDTFS